MMNAVTEVFAAQDNSEIDNWDRRLKMNRKRWHRSAEVLRKELRINDLVARTDFTSCWIAGYKNDGRILSPRIGFRRDKKLGYLVPDESSQEGKQISERLKSCSYIVGGTPGLPDLIKGEKIVGPFKLEKIGNTWFATLNFAVAKENLDQIDSRIWKSVAVSDYQKIKSEAEESQESTCQELQDHQ